MHKTAYRSFQVSEKWFSKKNHVKLNVLQNRHLELCKKKNYLSPHSQKFTF